MSASRRVAIVQSSYIPWKGYFDLIASVDRFVLFDDMQYTKRDWRNRNKIKTGSGALWLTIPVKVKGLYRQKIKDAAVSDTSWTGKHWKTIVHSYSRARGFREYKDFLEELYRGCEHRFLSDINRRFIEGICGALGIRTGISFSMDYTLVEGKNERLADLCTQLGATEYLSGPSAESYIDEDIFTSAGIKLRYMDYSGYPEYEQPFPPFDHFVSIVDLLLNEGSDAGKFMKL